MDFFTQHQAALITITSILVSIILIRVYVSGTKCKANRQVAGHTVVITGGNTGIGFQIAKKLYELGCHVIIGARDEQKSKKAVDAIKGKAGGKIAAFKLDLSDKNSIENFAQNVKRELGEGSLNYLVNNAGTIYVPERRLTKLGVEMQIGVNHFGHFYLTYLLWPLLKKSFVPRIINTSSRACEMQGMLGTKFDLNNLDYQKGGYSPSVGYEISKKANVLFTRELQKRINQAGLDGISVSLHPGIALTQCSREILSSPFRKTLYKIFEPLLMIFFKTSREASQTALYTILQRQQKIKKGQHYLECQLHELKNLDYLTIQNQQGLWKKSQQIFGIKFNI